MNQPASKDPSMDEILSSIRQIIADDEPPVDAPAAEPAGLAPEATAQDVGGNLAAMVAEEVAPPMAAPEPAAPPQMPEPAEMVAEVPAMEPEAAPIEAAEEAPLTLGMEQMIDPPVQAAATMPPMVEKVADDAPLTLSAEQMVDAPVAPEETEAAEELVRAAPAPEEFVAEFGDDVSEDVEMVVPDDIAFINDDDAEDEAVEMDLDGLASDVDLSALDETVVEEAPIPEEEAAPSVSPLPDPTLTTEMSEELLEPATQAAASSAFSQLDALTLSGGNGQTVEDLIREMLRPMLKGWLDENLPGVVEKLVQREIERVSRGNR